MKKLFTLFFLGVSSVFSAYAEGGNGYREVLRKTVKSDGTVSEVMQTKYDQKGREDTVFTTVSLGQLIPGLPVENLGSETMTVPTYDEMDHQVKIESYEMTNGDWVLTGITEQDHFDNNGRPCNFVGYERNEDTGEMEKKTLIVVERYTGDFCILESVTYMWVGDDWKELTKQTGTVDERGNRKETVSTTNIDEEGLKVEISTKISYEYYYEPVTCF